MTQRHRKIYLLTTDIPIRLIVTAIAAFAALSIWEHEYSSLHILEIVTVALMIRLAIRLQCGFIDQVSEDNDLKLFVNNLKSEIKFALAVITLLYLFDCTVSREVAVSFLVFNAIGQAIPICLGQMIRTLSKLTASDAAALGVSGPHGYKTALIYGTGPKGKRIADLLTANPNSDIIPVGFIDSRNRGLWSFRDIPLIGGTKDIERIALERQVDLIFMAAEDEQLAESREVFASAERMGAPVCVMPDLFNTTVSRCHLKTFNGQPALVYSSSAREGISTWLKTNADKALALMSIIIALPILLITAAVIKITSRGPALFKQTRVGQNGAQFEVYKFRSMYIDAENRKRELLGQNEMSGPVFKMKDDPRITPVGKFIRKYSIDELPQLFNVLKGEMSLVGPRPALPSEVRNFEPWQRRKLAVKPGVTCIWQVSGRNAIDFDDWMKLDLQYIDNWSLWMDAKIIARTIPTVLKGTGC